VVALGSNEGDSISLIESAFGTLDVISLSPVRRSRLWRSLPVDCPPGSRDFVNAVAVLELSDEWTPQGLLSWLKEQEVSFGRRPKKVFNEPRPLDLDLIVFGDQRIETALLTVPHPRAHLRSFVVLPLNELLPELCPPGWTETVGELASRWGDQDGILRIV